MSIYFLIGFAGMTIGAMTGSIRLVSSASIAAAFGIIAFM